jgi:hypothetical protein
MKFSSKLLIENVISSFAEFGASLNVFAWGGIFLIFLYKADNTLIRFILGMVISLILLATLYFSCKYCLQSSKRLKFSIIILMLATLGIVVQVLVSQNEGVSAIDILRIYLRQGV